VKLRNHWADSADLWEGRESRRMWYVTFDGQLDFLRTWLEPILDRPYLSPVPHEWLHMTLSVSDDADVEAVRERCKELQPIDALVGPARVVDEGVAGEVLPREEVEPLFAAVGVRGDVWPHVSFAYSREQTEMEELEVNASDAVYISAISLVDVRRADEVYSWEVVERLTLGS
jgi:hypothetical protein